MESFYEKAGFRNLMHGDRESPQKKTFSYNLKSFQYQKTDLYNIREKEHGRENIVDNKDGSRIERGS